MRRFAQLVGVLAALVALTSCYGRSATTGIDITVDCKVGFGGGGATDLGTFAAFTLDAPVWATHGAVIPLSNPTDGGPETQIPVTGLKAIRVSVSGLAGFQESADFNGTSQTLTNAFVAVTPGDQFGSASTGVTAPRGERRHRRLHELHGGGAGKLGERGRAHLHTIGGAANPARNHQGAGPTQPFLSGRDTALRVRNEGLPRSSGLSVAPPELDGDRLRGERMIGPCGGEVVDRPD